MSGNWPYVEPEACKWSPGTATQCAIPTASLRRPRVPSCGHQGQVQCDQQFAERIRLAVTQVNGCELCAYGHAKFALEAGMDSSEVRDLLGGITRGVPDDQWFAIVFGQHYADTRGHLHAGAWQRIVEQYGAEQALCLARHPHDDVGQRDGDPLSALRALRGRVDPTRTVL